MRQIANNTFNDGLLMDMQPLTTPNSVLTDCLNGTLITYDGNEFVLQSDDGNGKIYSCKLPKDFIPLGMKEYGGIVYIVSQNPFTGECEIGSFPSPESVIFTKKELAPETILSSSSLESSEGGLTTSSLKLDFGDFESGLLRPGDKFAIYLTDRDDTNNNFLTSQQYKNFEKLLEIYSNGTLITRNLYKLRLVRISEDGISESIKEIVPEFLKSEGKFYYNKSQVAENATNPDGFFAVYNNKTNGYLAVILEIEQIDEFNLNVEDIIIVEKDAFGVPTKYGFTIKVDSISESKNNVAGLETSYSILDNEGKIIQTFPNISKDIPDSELLPWNDAPVTGWKVPNTNIHLEQDISNLDVNFNVKVEVTPYSKFNYFNNLKYNNIFNYDRLISAQESNIWKYYLNSSMDTELTPDKMLISFDFFVRGTLNGRNKLDALYIEFYDVIANTSLFYPISSISDSKTISIDCFNDLQVQYTPTGGLENDTNSTTTKPYYILINKNKVNAYNAALKKIDDLSTGGYDILAGFTSDIDESKKIPTTYILESKFDAPKRYNNLGESLKNKYSKLRKDNFYIVAICGLDFYENDIKEIVANTYVSYNFLWTNGIFNKYWQLSGEDNDNFNLKSYPNFLNIEFSKIKETASEWKENLTVGDLSINHTTDNPNGKYSFQSYVNPVMEYPTNIGKQFDTRININGDISGDYKVSVAKDESIISYGKLSTDIDIEFIKPPSSARELETSEVSILENNTTLLDTNSLANTVTVSDGSGGTNYDPMTSINVKFSIFSNRRISDSGIDGELLYPDYVYSPLKDTANINICKGTDMLNIRCRGSANNRWMNFDLVPEFKETYTDNEITSEKKFKNSDGSEIEVNQTISDLLGSQDSKFVHLEGFADHSKVTTAYSYYTFNPSSTPPANTAINYNNSVFLFIKNGIYYGLFSCPYYFVPIRFTCGSNTEYQNLITNLNDLFKNDFYVRKVDNTAKKTFWIPNAGLVEYHNSFDTIFEFNINLLQVNVRDAKIKTYYKGVEQNLDLTFYNSIKNIVTSKGDTIIGKMFQGNNIMNKNLPTQTITDKDIILKDKFTLKNTSFILTKNNIKYTIGNIVEELKNPQKYVTSDISDGNGKDGYALWVKKEGSDLEYEDSYFEIRNNYIYITSSQATDNRRMIAMYDRRDSSKIKKTPLPLTTITLSNRVMQLISSIGAAKTDPFK